jgi:hypothetical protein
MEAESGSPGHHHERGPRPAAGAVVLVGDGADRSSRRRRHFGEVVLGTVAFARRRRVKPRGSHREIVLRVGETLARFD